ncbi:hypothetical protein KR018_000111 [Drosophila ironensis]|nr:hypothetical protein KR018_000111 [Drosophila ironensis]
MLPSLGSLVSWRRQRMDNTRRSGDAIQPACTIDLTGDDDGQELQSHDGHEPVLVCHPYKVVNLYKCPICLSLPVMPVTTMCGHIFCVGCLTKVLEQAPNACPLCRKTFNSGKKYIPIYF